MSSPYSERSPAASRAGIEHPQHLVSLITGLNKPFGLERSVKLRNDQFVADRFLCSVHKDSLELNPSVCLRRILDALYFPADRYAELDRLLADADIVHFGYEGPPEDVIFKCYLEFAGAYRRALAAGSQDEILVHHAIKWSPLAQNRVRQSRYHCRPAGGLTGIREQLSRIYMGKPDSVIFGVISEILDSMAGADDVPMFLRVTETGTDRQSFDLNLYDLGLDLEKFSGSFRKAADFFMIDPQTVSAWLADNSHSIVGHLSGGVDHTGDEFLTLYYGVTRIPPSKAIMLDRPGDLEPGRSDDPAFDFCLWPYRPLADPGKGLRPVNLLYRSFEVAGADRIQYRFCRALRRELGDWKTVFGVKLINGRISWEYYFYDYLRLGRKVSISRFLNVLRSFTRCDLEINEDNLYFMFSVDVDDDLCSGRSGLDNINIYLGDISGDVSAGICYRLDRDGLHLDNLYHFFDAATATDAIRDKIIASLHLSLSRLDLDDILIPELRNCRTIVIANKKHNDGIYFSGINAAQLITFMELMAWPADLIEPVRQNQDKLGHVLYDVGIDYRMRDGTLEYLKSAFYGVF